MYNFCNLLRLFQLALSGSRLCLKPYWRKPKSFSPSGNRSSVLKPELLFLLH